MNQKENRNSIAEAKHAAFRYLKYRPRSEREIIEKLRHKEFSEKIIQQTVVYLKRIGEIDDKRFSEGWVQSRLNKPFGIQRIRMELKQKGVSDEHIVNAIDAAIQDYAEPEAVLQLATQRLRQYRHVDQQTARRRLYGYLLRRGFSSGAVIKILNTIKFE